MLLAIAVGALLVRPSLAGDSADPAKERLANIEASLPTEPDARVYRLSTAAYAALDAKEFDKAESYANELLAAFNVRRDNWYFGNAVFHGNIVLGRVALERDGNLARAETYLLAAGRTPGSPQLASFGPNMSLAKELLERGERGAVLEFLDQCAKFWKSGAERLSVWADAINGGQMPDFELNLNYT
ncbi:MAG TPA: hypothetical protein VEJ86_01340 [Candidatus Binataceae bacterium]|nr:hypothetical protein [Candidatus Binataceae bacterium]